MSTEYEEIEQTMHNCISVVWPQESSLARGLGWRLMFAAMVTSHCSSIASSRSNLFITDTGLFYGDLKVITSQKISPIAFNHIYWLNGIKVTKEMNDKKGQNTFINVNLIYSVSLIFAQPYGSHFLL